MRVEIAICTWNRAALLDKTLARLRDLEIPCDVDWGILVVNNDCSDSTDAVIARHAEHLPIRRLFGSTPGLSHARNCASAAARGDLLLWTDDDVLVDRQWLKNYANAARREPSASFFGGPIEPWFETRPPAWFAAMLPVPGISGVFALRDLGNRPVRLGDPNLKDLPYGANFAVRTSIQREYQYDPRLGRTKGVMISGEESSLLSNMIADGHHGYWIPDARVRHFIPAEKLNRTFLRRFFVGLGRTNSRMDGCSKTNSHLHLWTQACYAELMYRLHWLTRNHRLCAQHLIHGCQVWGQLIELSSLTRRT